MNRIAWLPCLALFSVRLDARQQPVSKWEGEWGEYQRIAYEPYSQYQGRGVLITSCGSSGCRITVNIADAAGAHCSGSGELQMGSESSAMAHLESPGKRARQQCTLSLTLGARDDKPYLEIKQGAGNCAYFCTPNCTFQASFPFRSKGEFYGNPIEECFIGTSRARMAICSSKPLADLEKSWTALSNSVSDLENKKFQQPAAEETLLNECDLAAEPGECLDQSFQKEISDLQKRKKIWEEQVTEPGDRSEASREISLIEGTYERSFENGDVAGDTYPATDKLQIVRASQTSIDFKVHLNFFNGHECNASGTAEYKRNGTFVRQRKQSSGEICVLEIVPATESVKLADPTGKCRMYDCGARGGWNGAKFSFSERKRASGAIQEHPK